MTHADMDELYELYALGVLEAELGAEIDKHLEEHCPYCIDHVREASQLLAAMAAVAEPLQAPARLGERVLAGVRAPKRSPNWIFALAGLSAAAVALLIFSVWSAAQASRAREQLNLVSQERDRLRAAPAELSRSQQEAVRLRDELAAVTSERDRLQSVTGTLSKSQAEVTRLRDELAAVTNERDQLLVSIQKSRDDAARFSTQLAGLTNERDQLRTAVETSQREAARLRAESATRSNDQTQLRAAVEILSTPRTRTINFGHPESVPHGHVFLNPGGLVLVGSQSPPVPGDRTFELWLMPIQGAPQPAGLFRPNAAGQFVYTTSTAINTSQFKALAISIEPRQGSSAPTTKPIVVVPIG